ncbi:MAG TPA: hypothetical protein GXZ90_09195 [Clostridiales bacterium]|nr:hypothetical protein [Clostridiales bacterium]
MSKELSNVQKAELQLLIIADEICRENKIKYTLIFTALWGAVEEASFLSWSPNANIAMFYKDYVKFVEIVKEKYKNNDDFYILGQENCEQFEEVYTRFCKRGSIRLPQKRKGDGKYYDYYINISPIFYAGNTERERKQFIRQYSRLKNSLNALPIVKDTVKLKNSIGMVKRYYYYKRKSEDTYMRLIEHLVKYQDATKFVYIPDVNSKYNRISTLKETYTDLKEIEFCGHMFWGIKKGQEWIKDHYGPDYRDRSKLIMPNASLLDGPEILRQVQLVELDLLLELDYICKKNNIPYTLGYGTLLGAIRHKGFIPWDDDIDVIMLYDDYLRFLEIASRELDSNKYFLRWHKTDKNCNLTFAQIKRNDTLFCREGREGYNTHNGIFLDIIPMFNGANTWIQHKIQHRACRFFKTMLWAHMGHVSEKRKTYKFYYMLLAKISVKKSYALFMKYAKLFKNDKGKLSSLCIFRSPYNNVFTRKDTYEELIEVEFEGHRFKAPKKYHEILEYCYGDYMHYPIMQARAAKHLPSKIDIKQHVINDVMKRIGVL